ncbi:cell envelope biogenesis protein OmpA [Flavobacterium supellecticarium]|uniref:Cell envelope biogenesis protein OmpA n=1 Tax=Flavobacterium supellecticarium TaxID=2565924 RepID=A0A4S3ZQF0_9FLAO|nr:OmpA family protein [Flavobacterium supellecticarium]THF47717.1 cell envelope biogenesis protein OmpA [Flavobacterium supellecticarium]
MKKMVFAFVVAIISFKVAAQHGNTYIADSYFNRSEYANAADAYLEVMDKSQRKEKNYIYKQLADSYYNVPDAPKANEWYAKAIAQKQDAETYYRYAEMLKVEGKYEEASKQMKQFVKMAPRDPRSIAFKENPDYLTKLNNIVKMFDLKRLDFNSDKSDFGAFLSSDNILYFASARNTSRKIYGWNNEPFLDLYAVVYNANGTFSEPVLVDNINSKYHDGPATISADGNTMYFASESFKKRLFHRNKVKKIKQGQVNLFKATKIDGKWGDIKSLPFNSKDYSTSNPSLSKDGKTLYFSSNMPGSVGGVDIWKVAINPDGTYGKPQNLGKTINTKGNESFPFVTDDHKLFFASNGHQGFGGLDVYCVDLVGEMKVHNLGKPVNSAKDDFAFSFNKAKNIGFVSSNRHGSDNIYSIIPLVVSENTIPEATETDWKEEKEPEKPILFVENSDLVKKEVAIGVDGLVQGIRLPAKAMLNQSDDANGIRTTASESIGTVKKEDAIVAGNTDNARTDVTGENANHTIAVGAKALDDIYFDFDKSVINEAAAKELDKLVRIMNENPEMVVMVRSHTDSRGKQGYNLKLSEQRAESTVQYVISKGISKERIYGKGYGESLPKVNCQDDCTVWKHLQNRRSEFIIVKK